MSEIWDATYQAVRSKMNNCDIGNAVENVMREQNLSFQIEKLACTIDSYFQEYARPSILYKPKLGRDGNLWSVLLGDNPMEGIMGFGETAALAYADFDKNFNNERLKPNKYNP